MRSIGLTLALLVGLLGFAPPANGEDAPDDLRIEASVQALASVNPAVTIAPDGSVRATWEAGGEPGVAEFRLPAAEMARAREAVVASKFFGTWGPSAGVCCGETWTVSVRLGGQELRRAEIRYPPEFEPLRKYLDRFVAQASITAGLRRGDYHAAGAMPQAYFGGVAHLPAILDELVACAAGQKNPYRCGEAADLLLRVADPEDGPRRAQELLARLERDCRGAALTAWTERLRSDMSARRAAFAPFLLAEAEASAHRWASMTPMERAGLDGVLGRLLSDGDARAFAIAERMARAEGEDGKPFVPPGLVETGEAAVPLVVRLMDAAEERARANAVQTASILVGVLRLKYGLRERLSDAARAALEKRFSEEVVPALERRLRDASESYAVRKSSAGVLDTWDGRVKAAKERAIEKAVDQRKRDRASEAASGPPRPAGALAIAGRLLGPFDTPLPGFTVFAVRGYGMPVAQAVTGNDGSFRIEGLADGAYDLVDAVPGERQMHLRAPRAAEGVEAGRADVVLRLPGSMIRGRALDATGAPLAGQDIRARPRGTTREWPVSSSHHTRTDREGRFRLVRLPPGTYDLELVALYFESFRDGVGVETGPEERTVQVQPAAPIVGRVVDEAGAPVSSAAVALLQPGSEWFSTWRVTTSADGSFRFEHADSLRDHRLQVAVAGSNRPALGAIVEGVRGGTEELVVRLGDPPRLRFRVDYSGRGRCEKNVRVVRVSGGSVLWHRFSESPVDWVAAPPGTWRVFVSADDLDAEGVRRCSWVEAGTATTGEPEKTLTVPR